MTLPFPSTKLSGSCAVLAKNSFGSHGRYSPPNALNVFPISNTPFEVHESLPVVGVGFVGSVGSGSMGGLTIGGSGSVSSFLIQPLL
jgi:hypothetical protein